MVILVIDAHVDSSEMHLFDMKKGGRIVLLNHLLYYMLNTVRGAASIPTGIKRMGTTGTDEWSNRNTLGTLLLR